MKKNFDAGLKMDGPVAILINPLHVFSGAVSAEDFIKTQKQLLRDFGEDTYFTWQLEILRAEIASIVEEVKMDCDPLRNTDSTGLA